MNVCYDWNMNLFFNLIKCLCSRLGIRGEIVETLLKSALLAVSNLLLTDLPKETLGTSASDFFDKFLEMLQQSEQDSGIPTINDSQKGGVIDMSILQDICLTNYCTQCGHSLEDCERILDYVTQVITLPELKPVIKETFGACYLFGVFIT